MYIEFAEPTIKFWSHWMPYWLIAVIALHVLSSIFWTGTTFVLARIGANDAARLFRPQIGAASVTIVSGGLLWHFLHEGSFYSAEKVLALGAGAALAAFALQAIGAPRGFRNPAGAALPLDLLYRISAGLLLVTVLCMVTARHV
jgi:hypothetical protein